MRDSHPSPKTPTFIVTFISHTPLFTPLDNFPLICYPIIMQLMPDTFYEFIKLTSTMGEKEAYLAATNDDTLKDLQFYINNLPANQPKSEMDVFQEDFEKNLFNYEKLVEMPLNVLEMLAEDKSKPALFLMLIKSILKDIKRGELTNSSLMWDRLYGKAVQKIQTHNTSTIEYKYGELTNEQLKMKLAEVVGEL